MALIHALEHQLATARAQAERDREDALMMCSPTASGDVESLVQELESNLETPRTPQRDPYTPTPPPTEAPFIEDISDTGSPPRTPWVRKCYLCGVCGDGYQDPDPDQVQCMLCQCWSHRRCLDDTVDYDDPETVFMCIGCNIHRDPTPEPT